jgi:uncharacterized protein YjbI with pentapeptide repeats
VDRRPKPTGQGSIRWRFPRNPPSKKDSRWGFRGKTVWDWLPVVGAFLIPVVIAAGTWWITWQQAKIEDRRAQQAQKIENQRAEAERTIQQQNAQDEALQAYLDQMNMLLLEKGLRSSDEGSEVRTLARARTLTVLGRLEDPNRKTAVMQFLEETELIQRTEGRGPIIRLAGANLSGADLSQANLSGADLSDFADLSGASLGEANLSGANLEHADLDSAELFLADLGGTDLSHASLFEANLSGADLSKANLSYADLESANLSQANLNGADLGWADLSDAEGVTEELLKQEASSLEWASMPDGQIYVTAKFEPALSFRVTDYRWRPSSTDTSGKRDLFLEGPEGGRLTFTNPSGVVDVSTPSEPKLLPAPENADEWASWFQRHPNLEISNSLPVKVGSASGVQIDVTDVSAPDNYSQDCGDKPCVLLYRTSSNGWIVSREGWKYRFFIVDVEGTTVLIDTSALADKFDEFLPKAQKVLDTVEWSKSE